jgi:enolase-phosphatase E1
MSRHMWKYLFFLSTFALHGKAPINAILTDIEGTTTSFSFVHDTLFPYAKKHVRDYLLAHQNEPDISQLTREVAQIAGLSQPDLSHVTQILLTWMEEDKKITPLKTLQGMMWKAGYEEGHFQGHIYLDAFQELQRWHEEGLSLYVYSSGSVTAQKLLFSHSIFGDLTPLFSNYFDTKIGGKKESSSYLRIAEQLQLPADEILFLSDLAEELDAAAEAGFQTYLILRGGTPPPESCPHRSATNFHELMIDYKIATVMITGKPLL